MRLAFQISLHRKLVPVQYREYEIGEVIFAIVLWVGWLPRNAGDKFKSFLEEVPPGPPPPSQGAAFRGPHASRTQEPRRIPFSKILLYTPQEGKATVLQSPLASRLDSPH